jgi:hypothetical protein
MLIDCTHCQARVNAEVLKLAPYRDFEEFTNSYQLALLRCPECKHPLAGEQPVLRLGKLDVLMSKWIRQAKNGCRLRESGRNLSFSFWKPPFRKQYGHA